MDEYTKLTLLDFITGGNVQKSRSTPGYCRWICSSHKNAAQTGTSQKSLTQKLNPIPLD